MKLFITILCLIFAACADYAQTGWTQLNSGTNFNLHSIYFTDTSNGFVVGDLGAIYKTIDGGNTWQKLNPFYGADSSQDYTFNSAWFINPMTGFVIGNHYNVSNTDAILYCTFDGGANWDGNEYISGEDNYYFNSLSFADSVTGYAVGYVINYGNTEIYPLVMKTVNSGVSWSSVGFPGTGILRGACFLNAATGYSVGTAGAIFKTTDGASSWIADTSGYTLPFNSVFFTDVNTGYACADSGKIIKTINGGVQWTAVRDVEILNSQNLKSIAFLKKRPSIGYVAATGGVIKRTTDYGVTWAGQVTGTQSDLYSIFFVDTLTGFAAGKYGTILKTKTAGFIGIRPISQIVPTEFRLYQNYPNPFNPSTKIRFDIPFQRGISGDRSVSAKLVVYDILGREIAVLVNQSLQPGKYEVTWDAAKFASGIYFYRLESGGFVDTKKLVILK